MRKAPLSFNKCTFIVNLTSLIVNHYEQMSGSTTPDHLLSTANQTKKSECDVDLNELINAFEIDPTKSKSSKS